jgi:hypothetical protein
VEDQVWLMAHLSRWLDEQGMELVAFTDEAAERFQRARRERYSHLTGSRALRPLLGYLRGLGLVPEPLASESPAEAIVAAYRAYLRRERGLVEGSVVLRARVARLFLGELPDPIEAALARLHPGDVTRFVVAQCAADDPPGARHAGGDLLLPHGRAGPARARGPTPGIHHGRNYR